jgi:hypothetical protein
MILLPNGQEYEKRTPEPGKFPWYISSGGLELAATCLRKFHNSRILQLVPSHETKISPDQHAGKCLAQALETWRAYTYFPLVQGTKGMESIEAAMIAFKHEWGAYTPPSKQGRDHPKTKENTWRTFRRGIKRWSKENDWLEPYGTGPTNTGIELEAAIPLDIPHPDDPSRPLYYVVKMDAIMKTRTTKRKLYVLDDKSMGTVSDTWRAQWRTASQLVSYCWAARALGIPVDGYVVRGYQIAKTRFALEEHVERVHDWQLAEWEARMVDLVHELVAQYTTQHLYDRWSWPKTGKEHKACAYSYGRPCAYLDLCEVPPAREVAARRMFHVGRTSPFDLKQEEPK